MSIAKEPDSTNFTHKLYLPNAALRPFVGCYWIVRSDKQGSKPELMIPDGFTDLIFNFGGTYRRTEISPQLNPLEMSFSHIVGERKKSVLIEKSKNLNLVGIKLTPYGLWALTQIPAINFHHQIVPVDSLLPFLSELEERVYETEEDFEKIKVIENLLAKKLLNFSNQNLDIQTVNRLIINSNGNISINELSKTVNLSYKKLERVFEKFIGLPPKTYARVIRFKKLLQSIKQNPHDQKYLYLDFGFYDQNHYIKEFKHFTGLTPALYNTDEFQVEDKFFSLGAKRDWLTSPKK
jgi:AraC-like DNA-binding protein